MGVEMTAQALMKPPSEDWLWEELARAVSRQMIAQGAVPAAVIRRAESAKSLKDALRHQPDPRPRSMRRNRDDVEVAEFGDDGPTPQRIAKGDLIDGPHVIERQKVPGKRAVTLDPLLLYRHRGDITSQQFRSGMRLRRAFHKAAIMRRVTPSYAEPTGGAPQLTDRQADARHEYVIAMRSVGPELGPIVVHVVCFDGLAADFGQARIGWRKRSANIENMALLKAGLDALYRHYKSID